MNSDRYFAVASAYDLHAASSWETKKARIEATVDRLQPEAGVIVDIGAGSGAVSGLLLESLPEAKILAFEPSPSMRALMLQRIVEHPEWVERVTVRPESFDAALLPERIGGVLLLGVLGHFAAPDRVSLFAELARRLPEGGIVLIDVQPPERPERVPPYVFSSRRVGDLEYRAMCSGEPANGDAMRWRMRYEARDGSLIIDARTTEFIFHHPNPAVLAAEAGKAGLEMQPLDAEGGWLLERV